MVTDSVAVRTRSSWSGIRVADHHSCTVFVRFCQPHFLSFQKIAARVAPTHQGGMIHMAAVNHKFGKLRLR